MYIILGCKVKYPTINIKSGGSEPLFDGARPCSAFWTGASPTPPRSSEPLFDGARPCPQQCFLARPTHPGVLDHLSLGPSLSQQCFLDRGPPHPTLSVGPESMLFSSRGGMGGGVNALTILDCRASQPPF